MLNVVIIIYFKKGDIIRLRERVKTFDLTVADVSNLIKFQREIQSAFDMNTTQSKLSNAISAITGLYGIIGTFYSLPYSYASGIAALVIDTANQMYQDSTSSGSTLCRYGYYGLTDLHYEMTSRDWRQVRVQFGMLEFLDQGWQMVTSEDYTLISVDGQH
jgi:hypothetical protein